MIKNTVLSDEKHYIGFDEFGQLICATKLDHGLTVETMIRDVRGETCPLCRKQWELTCEDLVDQTYHYGRQKMVHKSCLKNGIAANEFDLFKRALDEAKLPCRIEECENEYKAAWNNPWYLASLDFRDNICIRFGRRKRVFHCELFWDNALKIPDGLFASEDTTKIIQPNSVMIHAWTDEKVLEYVKIFGQIATASAFYRREEKP